MRPFRFLAVATVVTLLGLAVLAVLRLLDIPSGDLVDWAIGLGSIWWILLITTVPWNVRFDALAALRESEVSARRGVEVDTDEEAQVRIIARRALIIALVLHAVTAVALFLVAWAGWSPVGYAGAATALGLTFARPSARVYAYLTQRLRAFQRDVQHPREDIVELRARVRGVEEMLDLETETAWASQLRDQFREMALSHDQLATEVEGAATANAAEHRRLEQEYRAALATVTEDRQFVEHLREIVRFVRRA
ncbi:MAG: hypothetical protein AAGI52_01985 [Bacteroidota bacterium]